jgi:hypothetical protein
MHALSDLIPYTVSWGVASTRKKVGGSSKGSRHRNSGTFFETESDLQKYKGTTDATLSLEGEMRGARALHHGVVVMLGRDRGSHIEVNERVDDDRELTESIAEEGVVARRKGLHSGIRSS